MQGLFLLDSTTLPASINIRLAVLCCIGVSLGFHDTDINKDSAYSVMAAPTATHWKFERLPHSINKHLDTLICSHLTFSGTALPLGNLAIYGP